MYTILPVVVFESTEIKSIHMVQHIAIHMLLFITIESSNYKGNLIQECRTINVFFLKFNIILCNCNHICT